MDFETNGEIIMLPIDRITPNVRQPRKYFDRRELENLSLSIRNNGVFQPITVRPSKFGSYEIISGERRYRASIMAGKEKIPSVIVESNDEKSAVLSLTENIQRQKITFFEEADAISLLITVHKYSIKTLSQLLGKPPSYISEKLDLLRLSPNSRDKIIRHKLTEGHAVLLLKLDSEKDITKVLNAVISKNLSVCQTEELVNKILDIKSNKDHSKTIILFRDIRIFTNTLNNAINKMKNSGINVKTNQTEDDEYIEYTVKIPKTIPSVIKS